MNYSKNSAGNFLRAAKQVLGFESVRATIANTSGLFKSTASLGIMASLMMPMASYGVAVTTQHNNNYRTGQNDQETILNVSNVNVNSFGKLYALNLAQMFNVPTSQLQWEMQVLYVPNVNVPGKGVHNAIFICTVYNSCYAMDADSNNTPLWQTTLATALPTYNRYNQGVRSTPVIDVASNTMYVVSQITNNDASRHHMLHALDITNGSEKPNSPVEIHGSVFGNGTGSNKNGILKFDPQLHVQRPGLLLQNGNIYIAFAGYEIPAAHGWIFSYNAQSLQLNSVVSTSADAGLASIWQYGNGLAADDKGFIYVHTGNNTCGPSFIYSWIVCTGVVDYSNSVLKIDTSNNGLNIADYFTPNNQQITNYDDADLSSSGPLLVPGTSIGVGGGKEGRLYSWNTNKLGEFNSDTNQNLQSWQITTNLLDKFDPATFLATGFYWGMWGGNVYYDGSNRFVRPGKTPLYKGIRKGILFTWGKSDKLKSVNFTNQSFDQVNINIASVPSNYISPVSMSISSNGIAPGTAILWTFGTDGGTTLPMLRAFDVSNITNILWDSRQNLTRDNVCGYNPKITAPTIANGKVYVPNSCQQILVYGLLPK
jgi:hypothetical protein